MAEAAKMADGPVESPATGTTALATVPAGAAAATATAGAEGELDEAAMNDLRNPDIVQKYRSAADIANDAVKLVISSLVPGRRIAELCEIGDQFILDRTGKVYNKGKVEKGIAFPTCVSVNHLAGHVSPLGDAVDAISLGDVVKVDLAVHVDGYIAAVAQTAVVTGNAEQPCTGRAADVVCAAYMGAEVAVRLLREGRKNHEITEALAKVAAAFNCHPLEGVLSHNLKRFVIDGPRVILGHSDHENNVDDVEFAPGDVFAVDIVMSTGEGKTREADGRTTVFKRNVDVTYNLKMKASRFLFSEINRRFPTLPFSLRTLDEDKRGRLGITEVASHQLVTPFPVLAEKPGELVAQFKFTVLVTPSGTQRITVASAPFAKSELAITDPDLLKLLAGPATASKKAKKSGKGKSAVAKDEDDEDAVPAAPSAGATATAAT